MKADRKNDPPAPKAPKKSAVKKQTYRDVPPVPTAKQIEKSISGGKTVTLEEFVKNVKL